MSHLLLLLLLGVRGADPVRGRGRVVLGQPQEGGVVFGELVAEGLQHGGGALRKQIASQASLRVAVDLKRVEAREESDFRGNFFEVVVGQVQSPKHAQPSHCLALATRGLRRRL